MKGPVVLLTTNLARGGAETQVALLAQALSRRGWRVSVVSLLPPSAFTQELTGSGVEVRSLGMRPGIPDARGAARLALILRSLRPRVLHSHMFHANLLARAIRLLCPVPLVISTLHSVAESGRAGAGVRFRDRLYRLTDWLADATVAVCAAAAERHAASGAVPRRKLCVIPNGVDTRRFRPDPARRDQTRARLGLGSEFAWLAVGRLMWKKNYPAMLAALARSRAGVLLIAGSGPLEDELRRRAHELGAGARFLGEREDIPELMNACDGLLLASVVEGLPVVLLEAAASGLPAIATDVGGAGEAVLDGRTGFLVPPEDPDALARAMTRMREMPAEARAAMGRAAREFALARFDLELVAAQWEQVYGR